MQFKYLGQRIADQIRSRRLRGGANGPGSGTKDKKLTRTHSDDTWLGWTGNRMQREFTELMHKEGLQLTGSGCWDVPFLNASDITSSGIREYLHKYKEKFLLSLHKELNQAEENLKEIDKKIPYFLGLIKKITNNQIEENIEKTSIEETIKRLKIYIKNVEEDLIKTRPRMGESATSRSN